MRHRNQREPVSKFDDFAKDFNIYVSSLSADLVGYSSPLSASFASSEGGLSVSLRSTTELKNIQPLVIGNPIVSTSSGAFEQQQPHSVIPSSQQPSLQRQQSIHDDVPMGSTVTGNIAMQPSRKK